MKRFVIERSNEEFSGLVLVGLALNCYTSISSALAVADSPSDLIAGIEAFSHRSKTILLPLSSTGMTIFTESHDDKDIPSEDTMRQRMNEYAGRILASVFWASIEFMEKTKIPLTVLSTGHILFNIDGFVLNNSGSKKEKVEAPIGRLTAISVFPPISAWRVDNTVRLIASPERLHLFHTGNPCACPSVLQAEVFAS